MIQNLRMRWKLVALLGAPLLGLVGFAGVHAVEQLRAVEESEAVAELAATAHDVDAVMSGLQYERRLSSAAAGGQREASAAYTVIADARDETDAAFDQLFAGEFARAEIEGRLEADAELVSELRAHLDGGPVPREEIEQAYSEVIDEVLATQRFIAVDLAAADLVRLDGDLARDLRGLVALSAASEAVAQELLSLERVLRSGDDTDVVAYAAQAGRARVAEEDALATVREDVRADLEATLAGGEAASEHLRDAMLVDGTLDADVVTPEAADDLGARADGLTLASTQTAAAAQETAAAEAEAAQTEGVLGAAVAVGIVVVALLLSLLITRTTERPIRELAVAAEDVADRQLPEMLAAVQAARPVSPEATAPIEASTGNDEIGSLARSFERVRRVAADTTVDLADTARRGVSELFVNLARRNQALVDRQIRLLDRLERHEEDPEVLERLFTLDHLATRMRRNAESLLVMAGAETPRRPTRPLPLSEVLQAAAGEVEDYQRVEIRSTLTAEVHGRVAPDLAHLLAELVENATNYSDPSTAVDVVAEVDVDADGEGPGAVIRIRDRGVGMTPEVLREANQRLADPPSAGFGVGRSLGFVVTGLLAQRHDISVYVGPRSDGDGSVATVRVPPSLLAVELALSEIPEAVVEEPEPDPEPDPGPIGNTQVRGAALLPGMALDAAPPPRPAPAQPSTGDAVPAGASAVTTPASEPGAPALPSRKGGTSGAEATAPTVPDRDPEEGADDVQGPDAATHGSVREPRASRWSFLRRRRSGARGARKGRGTPPPSWTMPAPGAAPPGGEPGAGSGSGEPAPGSGSGEPAPGSGSGEPAPGSGSGEPGAPWQEAAPPVPHLGPDAEPHLTPRPQPGDEPRLTPRPADQPDPLETPLRQRETAASVDDGDDAPPLARRTPPGQPPTTRPAEEGGPGWDGPGGDAPAGEDPIPDGGLPRRRPGTVAPSAGGPGRGLLSEAEPADEDPRETLSRYLSGISRARHAGSGDSDDEGGDLR